MALVNVVKCNGSQDVFAWKYPNELLGTWTQLMRGGQKTVEKDDRRTVRLCEK
jgi:hypothetical protein